MCDKAVKKETWLLRYVLNCYNTHKMCKEKIDTKKGEKYCEAYER